MYSYFGTKQKGYVMNYITLAQFKTLGFDVDPNENFLSGYKCEEVPYYDVISDILENYKRFKKIYTDHNASELIIINGEYYIDSSTEIDVNVDNNKVWGSSFSLAFRRVDNMVIVLLNCYFNHELLNDLHKIVKVFEGNTEKELKETLQKWFDKLESFY